jgi:hypothetical protein
LLSSLFFNLLGSLFFSLLGRLFFRGWRANRLLPGDLRTRVN